VSVFLPACLYVCPAVRVWPLNRSPVPAWLAGATKSLVVDLGVLLQSNTQDELPEVRHLAVWLRV
jgi:hypothetical protein